MNQVARETDYLVMDETGFRFSVEELETIFEAGIENPRELCLLAKVGSEVVGAISVKSSKQFRISHIGNIFIAVKSLLGSRSRDDFTGGSIALGRGNGCIETFGINGSGSQSGGSTFIPKLGFNIEGTQIRGARTDEGEWLDLYYMGKLIGEV